MGIQDKIAKNLLRQNREVLGNLNKNADGWHLEVTAKDDEPAFEYTKVRVAFTKNSDLEIVCDLADEHDLQVIGLQKHAGLDEFQGMIFAYPNPTRTSFHMASVKFPIDLVFIGSDSRVSKIVDNVQPGTPGTWGHPHTSAVIEVNGGFCLEHGVNIGDEVYQVLEKNAQINLESLRPVSCEKSSDMCVYTLTDGYKWVLVSGSDDTYLIRPDGGSEKLEFPSAANDILDGLQGYSEIVPTTMPDSEAISIRQMLNISGADMAKQGQEAYPRFPRKDVNPKMLPPNITLDRFKGKDLPDVTTDHQPMNPQHEETWGYDVDTYHDDDNVSPTRPSR